MALDRFVRFPTGKGPKKKQVALVVRGFFGDVESIELVDGTWLVRLHGNSSWELEGIEPDLMPRLRNKERIIEVYGYGSQVTITTRRADAFVNALADGLMQLFARYWEATEIDDGS